MDILCKIKDLEDKRLDIILKMEADYENMASHQEEDLALELDVINKQLKELVVILKKKIENN